MTTGMLRDCHMEQVMELFCQCFQDDHFYKRSFPSEATRMQDMRKAYGPSLLYCLRHGDCRGIWDGDTLTAFLLCFDYRKVRGEDFASFRMIFAGEEILLDPFSKASLLRTYPYPAFHDNARTVDDPLAVVENLTEFIFSLPRCSD